ncbi:ATP-binding protein [Rubrivirga sp. S365]|uniref:hybrid sensor histidine kinase/response regulator n=1 Tax=Rubrivirga sp. S365 TaxID=3076080 RepID=UPI0028C59013|nr:ATP-binding protein [Rubrivirga sp. S365]MDT7856773.1 ATP-binding protein [Rubrivirga sp. S365]
METTTFPFVASDLLSAVSTAAGELLDCNEPWREVFGDDELWGRLPPEDARFAQEYTADAARGLPVSHQVFLLDAPGSDIPVPVLLHFLPVRLPDIEPGRYPVSLTGEVLREPASWAAEQTRRRRMEMLGRMAMGVAHDFNNLLTTVLGHAELLRSDLARLESGVEPVAHLKMLERAAKDGAALVRKIQQYIRNEKDERAEPIALHEIAEEVLTLTRPYWYNEPRRRGIAIEVRRDLRPVPPILGTPTELREVLVNLVLNAVQAMPAGGTLTLTTRRRDTRAAEVTVGDTGVGMTETIRKRIFEPLYTTKGSAGSGMGLTMSQGIVQEHSGRIDVESAPGRGTVFRLVFPFAASHPAPVTPREVAPAEDGAGLRLLVVDDEPMVRTVTTKLLRMRGHEVEDADGGPAALDVLAAEPPFDVVVTDLSMPEMSGRELASIIRERYEGLPVLLLTGDTDAAADSEDVAAVVKKPFQLDALDAAIRKAHRG